MLGELLGKQKEQAVLPDVQEQSQCSVAGAELKEGQTSPPNTLPRTFYFMRWKPLVQTVCRRVWNVRASAPGNQSRHHRKTGAEGLSGAEGQQENQGAAAHG